MYRSFWLPTVMRFWASPGTTMALAAEWDVGRSDRKAISLKALVATGAIAFSQDPKDPEVTPPGTLPTPTDVPVPEPHDVPVPEPTDPHPPSDPGQKPTTPDRPGQDPQPRPLL